MTGLTKLLQNINVVFIYILAALLPVFFTPLTTEFYDTGKFLLLGLVVLLMLFGWGLRIIAEHKIVIVKTPLDLGLILFLAVAILSTVFSQTPSTALYGLLPKVHGSLLFLASLVLLYFLTTSHIKSIKQIQTILELLLFSGLIMGLVSLLAYFQIYLPYSFAKFSNFSLAGSPVAGTLFLSLLLPIALVQLSYSFKPFAKNPLERLVTFLYLAFILVATLDIVLVGNLVSWVAALFGVGLTLYFHLKKALIVPIALIGLIGLVVAILSYTPTLKDQTPLGKAAQSFQREMQLPFSFSWKISASAFRDSPILGTGPASYSYNFTQYKPIEINRTELWNLRLNTAHNQFLQTWAEEGGTGVLLLILISAIFLVMALKHRDGEGLALSGMIFLLIMALSPQTVLTQTGGFLIFSLFMVSLAIKRQTPPTSVDLAGNSTHFLIPTLVILPFIGIALAGVFFLGKLTLGEVYHRAALVAVAQNKGLDAYNNLVAAERFNSSIDLYRIDLLQTNFALANAIAAQRGPSEASPAGSLTDRDKGNIQTLLQQAIAEGRAAIALAPRSAANWETLALLYRQIQGVATNGLQFSLDSYGRAIFLDPLNPFLRLSVGGIYYQAKNYDLAVRFFDDAVSLKPDYANALYNLAIALRDKGNIQEAIQVTERLIGLLQDKPTSEDYKTASNLLAELREKLPPATQPTQSPPSALEQKNLPKVLDLPQPEKISTPPAVKK
ncbi:O-antigen ligase family protein [Candidatus Daviesbacteria bacterium]|nr:O-antigen ligase family protein [Candidatus Daviesbacteria bacterium]